VTGICYKFTARVVRHAGSYYMLYVHVKSAPEELRRALEELARRKLVEVVIICP
jgi:hypothetical protein